MSCENSNDLINFCHNIKLLRKKNNLSKRDMAKILCIGVGSLNKIERLEFPARLGAHTVFAASKHFKISASQLFAATHDK